MGEIIEFIRRHWVAYLIGAVLAVALGLGVSLVIMRIGTTPDDAGETAAARMVEPVATMPDGAPVSR